jgi:hypothetical protein
MVLHSDEHIVSNPNKLPALFGLFASSETGSRILGIETEQKLTLLDMHDILPGFTRF